MPVKIFVGNLQVESNRETEAALRKLFEQFGPVVECDILTGKNFGFVVRTNILHCLLNVFIVAQNHQLL